MSRYPLVCLRKQSFVFMLFKKCVIETVFVSLDADVVSSPHTHSAHCAAHTLYAFQPLKALCLVHAMTRESICFCYRFFPHHTRTPKNEKSGLLTRLSFFSFFFFHRYSYSQQSMHTIECSHYYNIYLLKSGDFRSKTKLCKIMRTFPKTRAACVCVCHAISPFNI